MQGFARLLKAGGRNDRSLGQAKIGLRWEKEGWPMMGGMSSSCRGMKLGAEGQG